MKRIIGFASWGNALDDPRLDDETFHQQMARLVRDVLPDDGGSDYDLPDEQDAHAAGPEPAA
jgi:hypothetical protein